MESFSMVTTRLLGRPLPARETVLLHCRKRKRERERERERERVYEGISDDRNVKVGLEEDQITHTHTHTHTRTLVSSCSSKSTSSVIMGLESMATINLSQSALSRHSRTTTSGANIIGERSVMLCNVMSM